jgi:glycosyltransferase involved in cell wall biosynthesis
MDIALVVQGRFGAFDLGRELLELGEDVTLFTNYPGFVVERWGFPASLTRSFVAHGLASRIPRLGQSDMMEPVLHKAFGKWAKRKIEKRPWDVVQSWSGVAEEILSLKQIDAPLKFLYRGSAHVRVQRTLLEEESSRTGIGAQLPSLWRMEREQKEYALADRIVVPSRFAASTFASEGVAVSKILVIPLAADPTKFGARADDRARREDRIASGDPLRVLYVGNLSVQKGMWDLGTIACTLSKESFSFRAVGALDNSCADLKKGLEEFIDFRPRVPEHELREHYMWADVFIYPTIQDGFSAVLPQARAAGLPVIATTNCGAPEVIHGPEDGWILPIRQPEAFVECLRTCDADRPRLAAMVTESTNQSAWARNWKDVALDYRKKIQEISGGTIP